MTALMLLSPGAIPLKDLVFSSPWVRSNDGLTDATMVCDGIKEVMEGFGDLVFRRGPGGLSVEGLTGESCFFLELDKMMENFGDLLLLFLVVSGVIQDGEDGNKCGKEFASALDNISLLLTWSN